MPRAIGQIDRHKNEAILDATAAVLAERGLAAPIEAIARLAGVSKQTIYNQFGSKSELVRALVARHSRLAATGLERGSADDPEPALTAFGQLMLAPLVSHNSLALFRAIIRSVGDSDEANWLVEQFYDAGPRAYHEHLTRFLEQAVAARAIETDDPAQAAEFFTGMVMGHVHLRRLLQLPCGLTAAATGRLAQEAAARFVRAYAPSPAAAAN